MPPIRLVHFADLHVGMENYGRLDPATGTSSRTRDFLDRLDEVVDYALDRKADLAIFAGDAFKTRDPEPTRQREFARRSFFHTLFRQGDCPRSGVTVKHSTGLAPYRLKEIANRAKEPRDN